MRGSEREQPGMFSYVALEDRIPGDHPLRTLRPIVNRALATLSLTFDQIYADGGRPSIPPEQLLRALFAPVLYTIRSERQLWRLQHNSHRWFVGLGWMIRSGRPTVFTKNRQRLLIGDGRRASLPCWPRRCRLAVERALYRDGTLVRAWRGREFPA
jgi:transposase